MDTFSQRHGYKVPDAEITVRHDAPEWLRSLIIDLAYKSEMRPSDLRSELCELLLESPDSSNWSEFPNIDNEARSLISSAPWFQVYDFIEIIYSFLYKYKQQGLSDSFAEKLNQAFRQKGVGWQLVDGKLQVRGTDILEETVREAVQLTTASGRSVARAELTEALRDLSRRPEPELTGAIQHAMAALECVAKDITGDSKMTLGEWIKKNPNEFPQPLGTAVEKLWGYTSQYGRHVEEGKSTDFREAEMVVGLASALSVYLLRKNNSNI